MRIWLASLILFVLFAMTVTFMSASGIASDKKATGVVFLDTNGNGMLDSDEKGLEGVRVSNGRQIVLTDDKGRYTLPVDDDTIVFVIKPREMMTRLDSSNLPRFYYIHKLNGSPRHLKYPGVDPTGPLPESINFPLYRQEEPDHFRILLFGDTQPYNMQHLEWLAHDIIEEAIGIEVEFGISLGDLVWDDLNLFEPLNSLMSQVGIPWYNIYGNHDANIDAEEDKYADETFERIYGPTCYSFDWGSVHFIILDSMFHYCEGNGLQFYGDIGERQLEFIHNDLALVPKDQLVVLSMHVPLRELKNRQALFDLLKDRSNVLVFSAHTHYQYDMFFSEEDGWQGPKPLHEHNQAATCGSWWKGIPDEIGIPHTTMSDGAPNGYSIVTFDGSKYSIRFKAARRPANYQMNIFAPWEVSSEQDSETEVIVNVFAGNECSTVKVRFGKSDQWVSLRRMPMEDPYFKQMQKSDDTYKLTGRRLPDPVISSHIWTGKLPSNLPNGTHLIEVRTTDMYGQTDTAYRVIRVK